MMIGYKVKKLIGTSTYNMMTAIYYKFNLFSTMRYFIRYIKHRVEKRIIVIGDSHVNFFSGNEYINWRPFAYHHGVINISVDKNKNFDAIHLGPALAYNVNGYGATTKAREKIDYLCEHFFQENDTVICVFGEIDLRVHVVKQINGVKKDSKEQVDKILGNYIKFLTFLVAKGYNVWCWGAIASQKDDWHMNESYPRAGTEQERNKATEYFNNQLEKLCIKNNIGFVSIFPHLINSDYETKGEYIADECHLSQKAWDYAEIEFRKQNLF